MPVIQRYRTQTRPRALWLSVVSVLRSVTNKTSAAGVAR